MYADSFFKIGSTHSVCQDFAAAGIGELPYVIISDGCSGAIDSDWGSRLLTRALAENIYANSHLADVYGISGRLCQSHCRTLNLPKEALTATLLSVSICELPVPIFKVGVFGDGCVVARKKDGTLKVINHQFSTGAPYYIRYQLDFDSHQQYISEFGDGELLITTTELGGSASENHPINVETRNVTHGLHIYEFPCEEYDLVAVISDGVLSFEKKVKTDTQISTSTVPMYSIIADLFKFKGYSGHFVQRRCIKQFKEFDVLNWVHTDDFSIGAIYRA